MLFRFLILSDEADDFKREIKIDSESTFLDLQNAILDSVGYTKDQMTSFFICDDDWSKKTEITLVEMDTSSEEDIINFRQTWSKTAMSWPILNWKNCWKTSTKNYFSFSII